MTRISMIHGIKQQSSPTVTAQPFYNYAQMTSGELNLNLIKEQLNILSSAHPESKYLPSWQKGIDLINDTIYKGVHGLGSISLFTGIFDSNLFPVAQAIRRAEKRILPASTLLATDQRNSVIQGIDPDLQLVDSKTFCGKYLASQYGQGVDYVAYDKCIRLVEDQNADKKLLNDKFEDSAHYILYEFVSNQQLRDWSQIDLDLVQKIFLHKSVTNSLSVRTLIDRDNLQLWLRNGVMRNNANAQKLDYTAYSPEETIALIMQHPELGLYNANGEPRIGEPITFAVCIAIAIIIATCGAIAIDIIRTFQGKDPAVFKDLVGMLDFASGAANGKDFTKIASAAGSILTGSGSKTTGTNTSNTTPNPAPKNPATSTLPNWVIPVAAAGVALLVIKK